MSDNEQPPNRRLVEAVYPAGTHLDYSRASSNGMRGNVRDDRDNSLIGQAELFDAPDRYADGYHDGYHDGYDHRSHDGEFRRYLIDALAREVTHLLGDLVYAAAAHGIDAARPRINAWVRHRVDKLRSRSPRVAAAALPEPSQEPGPEHAPPRPAAVTAGHQRVDPVLRADQGDACANAALERISARAVEVHGMAAHYAADLPAADAADEAMRQAVAAAAPGLAAAALQLIASDEALGLTSEQQMYMWERAAELDLAVVEDLTGTHTMPAEVVAPQPFGRD
ncbi:hypothetical protein [Streptomyces sp. 13-12-16]|uniref:hypothetical protein n=1 Tax=Streptomyces sp. 13-12-16 TaxID=1570823 RepID=UPI00117FB309|nr:hypothetical protein [Streptomyces sp. 13-12-16]